MTLLLLARLASAAPSYAVLEIEGMDDDCCAQAVASALDTLAFVDTAATSFTLGQACFALTGSPDEAAIRQAIEHLPEKYTLQSMALVDTCPAGIATAAKDPWAGVEGIDFAQISKGESIDLAKSLVLGRFTIVDFGATWCAPCHGAAQRIATYAKGHDDVAVRAVLLSGADAQASFAQPVALEHLRFAEGLPYFVAYDTKGKAVYKGGDLDALFGAIDRKRK
jgi:thiol-disulfide isomerase/thioredoxin